MKWKKLILNFKKHGTLPLEILLPQVTNTISSPINSTKPIEEIKISDELLEAKKKDEDREYQEKLKWEEPQ